MIGMDSYVRPHGDRAALLTIDVQNDVSLPGAPWEIEGTAAVVPRIRELVATFRDRNAPIVHVVRLYQDDGSNVDPCRRAAIEDGTGVLRPETEGSQLVDALKPSSAASLDADTLFAGAFQSLGPNEWAMYKPRWSAFHRTDLEAFVHAKSIDTVVICGCNFPNCPRTTIYDASQRDLRIVFVPDATSGTYPRALEEIKGIGAAVLNTQKTIDWMNDGTDPWESSER
ncbi:cysteine hydrolase family protein [Halocatena halophila]|uniref:cysteine hydrolase family protein n=1 Tax=Halocatena halophila TaxID=2814576 RepID=UPI002ED20957